MFFKYNLHSQLTHTCGMSSPPYIGALVGGTRQYLFIMMVIANRNSWVESISHVTGRCALFNVKFFFPQFRMGCPVYIYFIIEDDIMCLAVPQNVQHSTESLLHILSDMSEIIFDLKHILFVKISQKRFGKKGEPMRSIHWSQVKNWGYHTLD